MKTTLSAVYFLSFFVGCGSITRYISHIQNYVNLVSAYTLDGYSTIDFPPLADVSQVMEVNINMYLYAVNGFDEVAGNIELVVALEMAWQDEMSIIQSITFKIEEREEFLVPHDMIWTPKIVLTNAVGDTSDVGDQAYLCRFDMVTKRILWKPRVVVSGSCTPDVTFYPFDKQECDFIYTAWGFKSDEIVLATSFDAWDLSEYGESGEWDIDSTSTQTYIQNSQSYIKFTIVMVRKPLYFAFNILLPILVLCLLNSTVFLLPAESGERVGFSVTCFLSFMVLLNMIMDIMPRSSNPISFLCYYLVVMMSNSGAMTLVTILLMRVYHKPEKSEVPKWMQRSVTFVNCGCAKLRCCVLCCRFLRRKCCCEDKRKCGCNNKKKTTSEETLTEITVDKDQNIIEKPVKKAKSNKSLDKDVSKSNKRCCFLSFVKNGDTNSKCCCGCIVGCKKCKENETLQSTDPSCETKEKDSLTCFSCFRSRKRKIIDGADDASCNGDLRRKKIKSDENSIGEHGTKSTCMGFFHQSMNKNDCESEEIKKDTSSLNIKSSNEENADESKSEIGTRIGCFGRKNQGAQRQDKTEKCLKGCFTYIGGRPRKRNTNISENKFEYENNSLEKKVSEMNDDGKSKCFCFLRKTKVSTLDITDTDIENDVLPVSKRSEDNKTVKASFKGKDNLDSEETLLQRWEESTKSTTNKKGSSLNPIGMEEKTNNETLVDEEIATNEAADFTLKTISIKEKKANEKVQSEKDNTEIGLEIVRRKRPRRDSVKEKLPKPVVQEKVIVPRRVSKMSKISISTEEDSEESDIDSLADLEEEVSWPEVGRILDTFFFLAFAGGQAFLTVVFLVPLFTGDTKSSDS